MCRKHESANRPNGYYFKRVMLLISANKIRRIWLLIENCELIYAFMGDVIGAEEDWERESEAKLNGTQILIKLFIY